MFCLREVRNVFLVFSEFKNYKVGAVRLWNPVGTALLQKYSRYRTSAAVSCLGQSCRGLDTLCRLLDCLGACLGYKQVVSIAPVLSPCVWLMCR